MTIGSNVDPMVWCPRRALPATLWCRRHFVKAYDDAHPSSGDNDPGAT